MSPAASANAPGGLDPECLYCYNWDADARHLTRHEIIPSGGGPGTGMQINTADLNGDGQVDIAVGGKSATWLLLNQGR